MVRSVTKIYDFDESTPEPIELTGSFRSLVIAVAPLSGDELVDTNHVASGTTGTVELNLTPPGSLQSFLLSGNSVDLASRSFVAYDGYANVVTPNLDTITGCTHVAVTVTMVP